MQGTIQGVLYSVRRLVGVICRDVPNDVADICPDACASGNIGFLR